MDDPVVQKRIQDNGAIPVANTPEQFARQIKDEYESYRKVVLEKKLTLGN